MQPRKKYTVTFAPGPGSTGGTSTPSSIVLKANEKKLSEWGVHVDIINHRDPRDERYQQDWQDFLDAQGQPVSDLIGQISNTLANMASFTTWRRNFETLMINAVQVPDSEIESTLKKQLVELNKIVASANNVTMEAQIIGWKKPIQRI